MKRCMSALVASLLIALAGGVGNAAAQDLTGAAPVEPAVAADPASVTQQPAEALSSQSTGAPEQASTPMSSPGQPHTDSSGGGNGNCSNAFVGSTDNQCKSSNEAIQQNGGQSQANNFTLPVGYSNNANQNNQPGGGNSNNQSIGDDDSDYWSSGGRESGGGGGGNGNCSNVAVGETSNQCKSSNEAIQQNGGDTVAATNLVNNHVAPSGDQTNNLNQNNQPGGGNSNHQEIEGNDSGAGHCGGRCEPNGSYEREPVKNDEPRREHGGGGGGNYNCSNAFVGSTENQCKSTNSATQQNGGRLRALIPNSGSGDETNNLNQNNQPGGGNRNHQEIDGDDSRGGCYSRCEPRKSYGGDSYEKEPARDYQPEHNGNGGGGGGNYNCSNAFVGSTENQCKSTNEATQQNGGGGIAELRTVVVPGPGGSGDQTNNLNQNNQPGGGNSNHQSIGDERSRPQECGCAPKRSYDRSHCGCEPKKQPYEKNEPSYEKKESYEPEHRSGGGGNFNCSNAFVGYTENQCKSSNTATQSNGGDVIHGFVMVPGSNSGDQTNNLNQNNQPGGGNSNRQEIDEARSRPSYDKKQSYEPEHRSGGGGGNFNCSNAFVGYTENQCKSTNEATQSNGGGGVIPGFVMVPGLNSGDQTNNLNQNNQPGGGNSNRQEIGGDGSQRYSGGGGEGGSFNCSNAFTGGTENQCKSSNSAIQTNTCAGWCGDQTNNANQNNQPGGGNSNHQVAGEAENRSYSGGYDGGGGGGGNYNCSNAASGGTENQCKSENSLIQMNTCAGWCGDQTNNANQNNQPGGGNSNHQTTGEEPRRNCGCQPKHEPKPCGCEPREEPKPCGCEPREEPKPCGCEPREEPKPCGCEPKPTYDKKPESRQQRSGGNYNCSNAFSGGTSNQCKSTNTAYQTNTCAGFCGSQTNNLNQNNSPGGGNTNRQEIEEEGSGQAYSGSNYRGGGGGNYNCSNAFVGSTENQCKSSNNATQQNTSASREVIVGFLNGSSGSDQTNNLNQNNQPGGGNSNHQEIESNGGRRPPILTPTLF